MQKMNIKQKIQISGRNWNDIIRLSCFRELQHYADWTLRVSATYVDGIPVSGDDDWYGIIAYIGDTLIEYETGGWEVKHAHKAQ